MIQTTPQTRILVAVEPVDFRKGIDGLACLVKQELATDPFSKEWVFVFRNRLRTSIKLLMYRENGFWLCHKRMSDGKFRFWPSHRGEPGRTVQAHELEVLLRGDFGDGLEWQKVSVGE